MGKDGITNRGANDPPSGISRPPPAREDDMGGRVHDADVADGGQRNVQAPVADGLALLDKREVRGEQGGVRRARSRRGGALPGPGGGIAPKGSHESPLPAAPAPRAAPMSPSGCT